eukprot:3101493-Karenia_brevis.AAC.1
MSPSISSHSHMPGCGGRQGEFKDIPSPKRWRKAKINVMNIWKLHHDLQMCTYVRRAMQKPTRIPDILQPPRAPITFVMHATLDGVTLPHAKA